MPWVDALSDVDTLRRCIRDLVALSTLPAIWKTYGPRRIAESLAAALVSMLDLEFVHVSLPARQQESGIDVMRTGAAATPESSNVLRAALMEWLPRRSPDAPDTSVLLGEGMFQVTCAPIGFGGDAILIAGSRQSGFPTEAQRLLLGIATNDATVALQRWHAETEERRFVELVENSSDFIAFSSLDGTPQYINAAGLQLVGLMGTEEASHMAVLDFIVPEERARVRDELLPLVMRDGRWVGELHFRNFQTGAAVPFLVDWFRFDDPRTGRPMNFATVSRDLTAQKRSEGELRNLNETLEQKVGARTRELADANQRSRTEISERERANARLDELQLELFHAARLSAAGQLAAALAHELNQPLTAVTNSLNAARRLLAKGGRDKIVTAREVLEEAAGQALRAGQIIGRLRDFLSRGETEQRMESVPTMIKEASSLALIGSEAFGVKVHFSFDLNAECAFANRTQIQQVLANLMRNAVEAMAGGARRELAVTTALLNEETIEVSVLDSGPGLAKEVLNHLFEPFVSTKRHGMGLGLSICRSIVEAHGGKLRSESNQGGGTIFRFTLPAVPQHEENEL
jgi:PAS domain S-box-containing protein